MRLCHGNGLGTHRGYVVRASGVMARDPGAAAERIRGRLDRRHDRSEMRLTGLSTDQLYPIDANWLAHLHEALGQPWPCECAAAAETLYAEIMADFVPAGSPSATTAGVTVDGPSPRRPGAWPPTSAPRYVVETGVARGVTSRFISRRSSGQAGGRLVEHRSAERRFAPARPDRGRGPEALRDRWTYVPGPRDGGSPGCSQTVGGSRPVRPRQPAHGEQRPLRARPGLGGAPPGRGRARRRRLSESRLQAVRRDRRGRLLVGDRREPRWKLPLRNRRCGTRPRGPSTASYRLSDGARGRVALGRSGAIPRGSPPGAKPLGDPGGPPGRVDTLAGAIEPHRPPKTRS